MEFSFDVNRFLPSDVAVVSSENNRLTIKTVILEPDPVTGNDVYTVKDSEREKSVEAVKEQQVILSSIIDAMGKKSAAAQGLTLLITSGEKLKRSDHRLYITKDTQGNNGKGATVGIIKVGVKTLFMTDERLQQFEVNPLCVLDFYVHESRQRQGIGLSLFSIMLQVEKVMPVQLAIDRPSVYFLRFLEKHFDLDRPLYQTNKFVVFPGFFNSIKEKNHAHCPIWGYDGHIDFVALKKSLYGKRRSQAAAAFERVHAYQDTCPRSRHSSHTTAPSAMKKCLEWGSPLPPSESNKSGKTASKTCNPKEPDYLSLVDKMEKMKTTAKFNKSLSPVV